MKVLWGSLTADARGKMGGVVASRNKAGSYLRTKVSPVQPNTPPQQAVRYAMTAVAQAWRDTLTAAMRALWEDYALTTPLRDVFGAKKTRSGISMFTRYNTPIVRMGGSILTTAPAIGGEVEMTSFGLTGTVADGVKMTTPAPALVTAYILQVQLCKAPTSAGVKYFSGPWLYSQYVDSLTVFPKLLVAPALMAIGQRWWVKTRLFDNLGRTGPNYQVSVDILA